MKIVNKEMYVNKIAVIYAYILTNNILVLSIV